MGALSGDPGIRRSTYIFVASKPWSTIADGLPQYVGHAAAPSNGARDVILARVRCVERLTMKRAALEKTRTVRTWQRHLAKHGAPVRCACEFQAGRFRKGERVGGCGRARCFLCHGEKLNGVPTRGQRRAEARHREGLADVLDRTGRR